MERYDIAIIGTGPAGVSAALTARNRNKSILLLGSRQMSEKVAKAHEIRNYPGLPFIRGQDMAAAFRNQLDQMEIPVTEKRIGAVYAMGDYFALQVGEEMLEAEAVILAGGVVQGKPLPVGTLYLIPLEDQSETRHGKERSRHSAVEFIGRYLAHDLDDVLNRCVLHVQFVGVYILEGYLVEDGRIDAQEEREDSIGREEIDEQLQGVVVSDALAQHIVARHVSGTDNQVAARAHEPVVAPHEGAYHIYQHLAQPQTLGLGLLAAVRAKISLERVAAIKTTIRLFRFRFFHIVYLTMGAEASACSS